MSDDTFDELQSRLAQSGATGVFDALVGRLRDEGKLHELFDVLLMRSRHRLGLPLILSTSLDELAEPLRSQPPRPTIELQPLQAPSSLTLNYPNGPHVPQLRQASIESMK